MTERDKVFETKIKHKGFFPYSEMYKFMFEWLKDSGYKIKEKEYGEKMSGAQKEIKFVWEAKYKISDYFIGYISMTVEIKQMEDAEVMIDGQKQKTNKGDLKISMKSELERDATAEWEKKPFWRFVRGVYDKYIIENTRETYEDQIKDDSKELVDQINSFLRLEKAG